MLIKIIGGLGVIVIIFMAIAAVDPRMANDIINFFANLFRNAAN